MKTRHPQNRFVVRNQKDVAEFFKISTGTFQSWMRRGCPVGKVSHGGGEYDLIQIMHWRQQQDRETTSHDELASARCEVIEAKLRRIESSVVLLADWHRLIDILTSSLEQGAIRAGAEFGKEAGDLITSAVAQIRRLQVH